MFVKSMMKMAVFAGALAMVQLSADAAKADPENTINMHLKCGKVEIKLRPDVAPKHVAQIKKLTRQGFYDGIIFHRVIEGFMAQTGDPTGTGRGGSELPDIQAEFNNIPYHRGVVGMARSQSPHSANSQFFIMFKEGRFLDGKYTAWGQVVSGMGCVDQINRGEPPSNPDRIIKMEVAADTS